MHVSRNNKGKQPHVLQEAMQGAEAYTQKFESMNIQRQMTGIQT